MKVVVTRVNSASVEVDNTIVGNINKGLLILVGFTHKDTFETIKYIANKIINLRIFDDSNGVMNLSVKDINGSILSVSQFTLYADSTKGNRPSYIEAMNQIEAKKMYKLFNEELKKSNLKIEEGIFHANMKVESVNDGPITIILER